MCSKHVLRDVLKFRSVVYNRAHGAVSHVCVCVGGGDPPLLKRSWKGGGGCGVVDFKNGLPGANSTFFNTVRTRLIIFFKTRKEYK